jgi:hypothetical protein
MSETIAPFADLVAKRKATSKPQNDNDGLASMESINNILRALEGMQEQVQALTDVVVEQDKRLEKLERRKIIRGIGS